nr:hypothetical protein [Tanacetum cinerariifolium]
FVLVHGLLLMNKGSGEEDINSILNNFSAKIKDVEGNIKGNDYYTEAGEDVGKIMMDDDGFFFFKFASQTGVEQGPWMIRNTPIILNKWTPNISLTKDAVTKVPVWVKLHEVHVVAYSEDWLSLIAT